ncbi:MAG: hypothetical protein ACRDPW_09920 [Mycobacteriales bacterium]
MRTSESTSPVRKPGRLTRMLSALRPHPLRRKAHQEVVALGGGLDAFSQRYGLDHSVDGLAELSATGSATSSDSPVAGNSDLTGQLRDMVQQAREYLHQLEAGKLPQQIPEFAEMVAALESSDSSSAAGLSARTELAGLLRRIDKLDNHWLAEARRKRQPGRTRVGRDVNRDNIDDNVQRRPEPQEQQPRPNNHQLSGVYAKTLLAQAARRRDELAERVERARLEDEFDDDVYTPDASVDFWARYGEEMAQLLVVLGYCTEGTQVLGSSRVAELMGLDPRVPPFELLERLRNEFEGRYLPVDYYDRRILYAVAAGMPVAEAVALNERDLLDDRGVPELAAVTVTAGPESVIDSGTHVQAARPRFATPVAIAARAPWQPTDPAEETREIRSLPDVA